MFVQKKGEYDIYLYREGQEWFVEKKKEGVTMNRVKLGASTDNLGVWCEALQKAIEAV